LGPLFPPWASNDGVTEGPVASLRVHAVERTGTSVRKARAIHLAVRRDMGRILSKLGVVHRGQANLKRGSAGF
jgi:hypothetical protein